MDQDINFQQMIAFAAAAATYFFLVPYRCTLRTVSGIVQADPGDGETITMTNNGDDTGLGVLTFGTDIAAGATGVWVADATNGSQVLEKGDIIKIVTSAGAVAQCDLNIEFDPYAR